MNPIDELGRVRAELKRLTAEHKAIILETGKSILQGQEYNGIVDRQDFVTVDWWRLVREYGISDSEISPYKRKKKRAMIRLARRG